MTTAYEHYIHARVAVLRDSRDHLQRPRRHEFDLSSLRVGTFAGPGSDLEPLAACIAEFPFPGLV